MLQHPQSVASSVEIPESGGLGGLLIDRNFQKYAATYENKKISQSSIDKVLKSGNSAILVENVPGQWQNELTKIRGSSRHRYSNSMDMKPNNL